MCVGEREKLEGLNSSFPAVRRPIPLGVRGKVFLVGKRKKDHERRRVVGGGCAMGM